jgi:hypothetical protein
MYEWIWLRLPGGTGTRAASMALIALAVAALLWFLVFPWARGHLPLDPA